MQRGEAIAAGKHVWCEKPMAMNASRPSGARAACRGASAKTTSAGANTSACKSANLAPRPRSCQFAATQNTTPRPTSSAPVTRLEFLVGKQLPYVGLAMVNFLLMCAAAITVFGVPITGSFWTLALAACDKAAKPADAPKTGAAIAPSRSGGCSGTSSRG